MFDDDLIENVKNYPILYRTKGRNYKNLIRKDKCWTKIAAALNKSPEECKAKWRNIRDSYNKNKKKKITGGAASFSKYDDGRLNFLFDAYEESENVVNLDNSTSSSYSCEGVKEEYDSSEEVPLKESPYILEITSDVVNTVQPSTYTSFEANYSVSTAEQNLSIQEQDPILQPKRTTKRKMDTIIEEMKMDREERNIILQQLVTKATNSGDTSTHKFFSSMADVVCNFPPEKIAEVRMRVCNMVSEIELSLLRDGSQSTSQY